MTSKGRSNSKQLDQEREQHQVDENNEFWGKNFFMERMLRKCRLPRLLAGWTLS
jgi:hypothetical protein